MLLWASLNDRKCSTAGQLVSKRDWNVTELNQELGVEKGEEGEATELSCIQGEELHNEEWHVYYWHLFSIS